MTRPRAPSAGWTVVIASNLFLALCLGLFLAALISATT